MTTLKTTIELDVEVEYEYHRASKGAREPHGLQIEPDEPEQVEINSVFIRYGKMEIGITGSLSAVQLESLESQCLDDVRERREAAEEQAAEDREDR
jgi:hypothetical protein